VTVTVTGTTTERKTVEKSLLVTPWLVKLDLVQPKTATQPSKGVAGHFAVGTSISLEPFNPGDYTVAIKVTDRVTKRTYDLKQAFQIIP
jgi:hypothetical protein